MYPRLLPKLSLCCPKCQSDLMKSTDPNIYFLCPQCGYVIWAGHPEIPGAWTSNYNSNTNDLDLRLFIP